MQFCSENLPKSPIPRIKIKSAIAQGLILYQNLELPWLRWWDNQGNLLMTGWEPSQFAQARVERLAAKLRESGVINYTNQQIKLPPI